MPWTADLYFVNTKWTVNPHFIKGYLGVIDKEAVSSFIRNQKVHLIIQNCLDYGCKPIVISKKAEHLVALAIRYPKSALIIPENIHNKEYMSWVLSGEPNIVFALVNTLNDDMVFSMSDLAIITLPMSDIGPVVNTISKNYIIKSTPVVLCLDDDIRQYRNEWGKALKKGGSYMYRGSFDYMKVNETLEKYKTDKKEIHLKDQNDSSPEFYFNRGLKKEKLYDFKGALEDIGYSLRYKPELAIGSEAFIELLKRKSTVEKMPTNENIYIERVEEVIKAYEKEYWEIEKKKKIAKEKLEEEKRVKESEEKQKNRSFWVNLNGREFEREIYYLFKRLGFDAELTQYSADGGIDLVLKDKLNKKIIVQCKNHKNSIGVNVIRELYGVMIHDKAQMAILICPGGFHKGIYEFTKDKPIDLIDFDKLYNIVKNNKYTFIKTKKNDQLDFEY